MTTLRPVDVLVAAAALFGGRTLDDIDFKIRAFDVLSRLAPREGEDGFDRFDLLAAVEDFAGARPDAEILRLVRDLQMFERRDDGTFRRRDRIFLADLVEAGAGDSNRHTTPSLLIDVQEQLGGRVSPGVVAAMATLRQAWSNVLDVERATERSGLPCPPPFWRVDADGGLALFSAYPSSTAAADQFSLFAEAPLLVPTLNCPAWREGLATAEALLERCLQYIVPDGHRHGYSGALCVPDDDDYPGGTLPTVPTNALFVIALRLSATARIVGGLEPNVMLSAAVPGCVRFLLTMQLESGAWSIHRYIPGAFSGLDYRFLPDPYFTAITVTALKIAQPVLDNDLKAASHDALHRCAGFILAEARDEGEDGLAWHDRFEETGQLSVYATLQAAMSLLKIGNVVGDDGALRDAAFRGLAWAERHWRVGREGKQNIDQVKLRAPTATGPAQINMTWEQPGHAKAVSAFIEAFLDFGYTPAPATWSRIEEAVAVLLGEARDGFWTDFYMPDKRQSSNTATCAMTLARYIAAVGRLAGFSAAAG
ncbi:hypothetical protein [Azospirillum lipoferum]|uniref:Uncharacterized protein n=1 Tax=Azospirillum lipoferum (strain 4B) TaxID=862719 RepID=G7Z8J6_AZOL4|nr:hypothetical protein [Azospirillum lipoferum]CBS87285.1 protein of unknown function; putative Terpenoid cyclases/Protein prenyltransferase domain [Azospirillum lipoferum 4B]